MVDHLQVSYAIPPEWQAKLERLAAARNLTSAEVLYEAIAHYLGEDTSRLQTLEDKILVLQEAVADLNATVTQLKRQVIAPVLPPNIGSSPSLRASTPTQPLSYEDVEDEPDEILYDFLEP